MKRLIRVSVSLFLILCIIAVSACSRDVSESAVNDGITGATESTGSDSRVSLAESSVNDGAVSLAESTMNDDASSTESAEIGSPETAEETPRVFVLPAPDTTGSVSVEQALAGRRSRRDFQDREMPIQKLSQILWAAYGITEPRPQPALRGGLRTTPSAGALYPLELYVIVGNVEGLTPGVYRYVSEGHKLVRTIDGDVRNELREAALGQRMVSQAPVSVFYSAVFERTTRRYGERGRKYVYIELGHSAQNVYLQVEALGLGTVAIGAFADDRVREILDLPGNETPLYLMPIGYFN